MLEENYINLKLLYEELEIPVSLLSKRWLSRFVTGFFWNKSRYYKVKNEQITIINLYMNNLLEVPEIIGNFTDLIHLDLKINLLNTLPESIGNLLHLKLLDISDNVITQLPESVGNLSTLRVLNAHSNLLDKLPENFDRLNTLRKLDLSENNFTNFPIEILNLENIIELDLSNNEIQAIPPEIKNLKTLKRLDLSDNQIEELPEELLELPKLKSLTLLSNSLNQSSKDMIKRLKDKKVGVWDSEKYGNEKDDIENQERKGKQNISKIYLIPLILVAYIVYMFLSDRMTDFSAYVIPFAILIMVNLFYTITNNTTENRNELRIIKENFLKKNELLKEYSFLIFFDTTIYVVFALEVIFLFYKLTNNQSSLWIFPFMIALIFFVFLGLILKPVIVLILRKKRQLKIYTPHIIPVKFALDCVLSIYLILAFLYVL